MGYLDKFDLVDIIEFLSMDTNFLVRDIGQIFFNGFQNYPYNLKEVFSKKSKFNWKLFHVKQDPQIATSQSLLPGTKDVGLSTRSELKPSTELSVHSHFDLENKEDMELNSYLQHNKGYVKTNACFDKKNEQFFSK